MTIKDVNDNTTVSNYEKGESVTDDLHLNSNNNEVNVNNTLEHDDNFGEQHEPPVMIK